MYFIFIRKSPGELRSTWLSQMDCYLYITLRTFSVFVLIIIECLSQNWYWFYDVLVLLWSSVSFNKGLKLNSYKVTLDWNHLFTLNHLWNHWFWWFLGKLPGKRRNVICFATEQNKHPILLIIMCQLITSQAYGSWN